MATASYPCHLCPGHEALAKYPEFMLFLDFEPEFSFFENVRDSILKLSVQNDPSVNHCPHSKKPEAFQLGKRQGVWSLDLLNSPQNIIIATDCKPEHLEKLTQSIPVTFSEEELFAGVYELNFIQSTLEVEGRVIAEKLELK